MTKPSRIRIRLARALSVLASRVQGPRPAPPGVTWNVRGVSFDYSFPRALTDDEKAQVRAIMEAAGTEYMRTLA